MLFLAWLGFSKSAWADKPPAPSKVAVGFSNLVARLDNDEIGLAKAEYRVHILEALRDAGFNAVGAESLVFGKDEAERADLVLGGTVKELRCGQPHGHLRCSVGIEWQLLDRERDEVVYRVLSRYAGLDLPRDNNALIGRNLVLGALHSLLSRARFRALLDAQGTALPADDDFPLATFAACAAKPRELPADFEDIANGTVIIKSAGGTGSGFSLTADGLIMTAAHVVSAGKVEVHTRDGKKLEARVVRISHKHDVALLWLGAAEIARPCLALEPTPQSTGTDVYAIGSPGGEQLGFSLSRGIVSGLRTIGDVPLIQTDASLSPGNSGGPLVDGQGRVVGVVSRKVAGHAIEGLGFAIPIAAGLQALKLESGASTTASLQQALPSTVAPTRKESSQDKPDPPVSLDPEGDRQRALAQDYTRRVSERDARTPGYVMPMRWLGLAAGMAGALGIVATGLEPTDGLTRSQYRTLRLENDLSWVATVLGFGAFTTSYWLQPNIAPTKMAGTRRWSLAAGPTNLKLNVLFQ